MKKYFCVLALVFLSIYILGCGKKEATMEEALGPMPMEAFSPTSANVQAPAEAKPMEMKVTAPVTPEKLEALPPAGPYKPSNMEIQTALKNAGYYIGEIDGKIGPKTKKAIEEFQKANGLQADGKVGPKTWAALSSHLNPTAITSEPGKKR